MTDNQQQNGPAAFGKIKKFDNGGRVIQWAFDINDLKKFVVRNGKVYFRMTELQKETQYGAKYLIREDEYMANYNWESNGTLADALGWEEPVKEPTKIEDVEVETDFKTGEVISAGKATWLKPWDIYKDGKVTKKEDIATGPSADPAPWTNIDDLFA